MRILLLAILAGLDLQVAAFQGGARSVAAVSTASAVSTAAVGSTAAGVPVQKSAAARESVVEDDRPDVRIISGQVFAAEDHGLLEGVKVIVRGTRRYSGSWQDGAYYMPVREGDSVLEFSKEGYEPQTVRLGSLNEYCIIMRQARPVSTVPGFSAPGQWRGVFEPRAGLEVPFNFEIKKTAKGLRIYFLNAEEKFDGGQVRQTEDSLWVSLEAFDNELAFGIRDKSTIEGVLRRQDGKGTPIPVHAETGKTFRFQDNGVAPAGNISGTYDIVLNKDEKAVGLFQQDGNNYAQPFFG